MKGFITIPRSRIEQDELSSEDPNIGPDDQIGSDNGASRYLIRVGQPEDIHARASGK
jgi:hypothetical protein